jgi:hypothetical protein
MKNKAFFGRGLLRTWARERVTDWRNWKREDFRKRKEVFRARKEIYFTGTSS